MMRCDAMSLELGGGDILISDSTQMRLSWTAALSPGYVTSEYRFRQPSCCLAACYWLNLGKGRDACYIVPFWTAYGLAIHRSTRSIN